MNHGHLKSLTDHIKVVTIYNEAFAKLSLWYTGIKMSPSLIEDIVVAIRLCIQIVKNTDR